MNIEYPKGQVIIRTDVAELLAFGRDPKSSPKNTDILRKMYGWGERFYGRTVAEAQSLTDYPDGIDLVERYRRMMPEMPQLATVKRRSAWRDDGDEFDRDRFGAGYDDCWRTRAKSSVAGLPIIRLTCEFGNHSGTKAADLVWSGAVATAVSDAAESAGWRVEIDAVYSGETYNNARLVETVSVKAASDPLDINATVLALCCPTFFRWHVLASMTAADRVADDAFGPIGRVPAEYYGDIHIRRCDNQSAAESEIRRIIEQIEQMAVAA